MMFGRTVWVNLEEVCMERDDSSVDCELNSCVVVGTNAECTDGGIVMSEKINNMTKKCVVDVKASTEISNLQSRFEL